MSVGVKVFVHGYMAERKFNRNFGVFGQKLYAETGRRRHFECIEP